VDARGGDTGRFGPLVLCYHAASDGWEHKLSVPPAALERQLGLLLAWYRPVPADGLLTSGRRALHVTFDDAYRSIDAVLPALRRRGVPATVFACSGYADDGRPLDVPELADEVAAQPAELATMGWDELRALADDGVEIGSHTVSHPHLPRLDDAELRRELTESREHIADELRRPCRYLAYPFGDEGGRVRAAARAAGYEAAFSLPGAASPVDAFGIPRLGVWRKDHLPRLLAKVAFARPRTRPAEAEES
jgi:peptidoglycan/xylan/chitin deacetylase (PgdA/CDA1 family)